MQIEERDGGTYADIFWDDLCQDTQNELLVAMGDNGNYDVYPFGSICIKSEEERL